jgi:hypothetical protein
MAQKEEFLAQNRVKSGGFVYCKVTMLILQTIHSLLVICTVGRKRRSPEGGGGGFSMCFRRVMQGLEPAKLRSAEFDLVIFSLQEILCAESP